MSEQQQQAQLATRPTLSEAIIGYEKLRTALRKRLTRDFGVTGWTEEPNSAEFSGCAPQFPALTEQEAGKKFLPRWYAPTSLLSRWNEVKPVVREIVGGLGFTTVALDANQAGDAELNLTDQLGAQLSVGTSSNTVLSLTTGCHPIKK
ncbi:LppA family lipoprotein [Amycolatopsis australiensis]|uniref:Lipoprotein n=1 Tax=Amycolatopsis australiensis TaxID=546364 RepID=A0A1K1RS72_9PSEU|nr:LppA family lipoprotein [Amycolatopsis australiensis]SFW74620.1 Lipoprotein [Amycolatopsis australiensis]